MHGIYLRLFFLFGFAIVLLSGCGRKPEAASPVAPPVTPPAPSVAPPVVLVATATVEKAPLFGEAIATLDGSINTPIRAEVSGYLIKQDYKEGADVKPGDLLFEIDPRAFQAEMDKVPAARTASSLIKIVAPVGGIVGKAMPGIGDQITPGMLLTTISTVDPIRAAFTITESFYRDHAARIGRLSATPPGKRIAAMELLLPDDTPYPRQGTFDHMDHQTQGSTGVITVYALFPNPEKRLRPGQYAKIRGLAENVDGAVVVPQRAVNEFQGNDQVMVVKPDNTVEIRTVTTGDRLGALQVIIGGLNPSERVVVEGFQKCQPGARVIPKPSSEPGKLKSPSALLSPVAS